MEVLLVSVISLVAGVLSGGYLGYRYGKSVRDKTSKVLADVKS